MNTAIIASVIGIALVVIVIIIIISVVIIIIVILKRKPKGNKKDDNLSNSASKEVFEMVSPEIMVDGSNFKIPSKEIKIIQKIAAGSFGRNIFWTIFLIFLKLLIPKTNQYK